MKHWFVLYTSSFVHWFVFYASSFVHWIFKFRFLHWFVQHVRYLHWFVCTLVYFQDWFVFNTGSFSTLVREYSFVLYTGSFSTTWRAQLCEEGSVWAGGMQYVSHTVVYNASQRAPVVIFFHAG